VPCPAALAILLASASTGDIGKGLALVIIFSFGLAASLVAIGLVVVSGVKAAQRFVDTERFAARIGFASAVIVMVIGIATLYSSITHFKVL
jgi:nickel/cobalt exporter